MNATKLIAAVATFAIAGSVFAGELGKTRAEVVSELQQARASGSYVVGGVESPDLAPVASKSAANNVAAAPAAAQVQGKTRAQVYRELVEARQDPAYVVGGREFVDTVFPQPAASRYASKAGTDNVKAN